MNHLHHICFLPTSFHRARIPSLFQTFPTLKPHAEKCAPRTPVRSLLLTNPAPTRAPVLILPGLGNASPDYIPLANALLSRGHAAVSIAPIARWQWALNARAIITPQYWTSSLTPRPTLNWYFAAVDSALAQISSSRLNILAHSAAGWLARAYIAENASSTLQIATLLTLGTPHCPPPPGRFDQTRGLLRYVEHQCQTLQGVESFVSVAGCGTRGKPLGSGSVGEFVAYLSYAAVCGRGDVDGDGVTPCQAACARDSHIVYCDACDHSMLTSENWYGSDSALNCWASYLM